ncbi:SDR family NAD(P)-dependent oxidoreductase [Novosphingobium album (ex Hu et al. 2023)]|uniref:SDR family oxidoreductase n=1 Tax=Novosphingobium album (ex Hu et al. 2023) TaxID=2930093 RepID=A0ABT0B770_9SPHN|nr:SDR family NAD(P)-dependent oxidoreductase [Novosphingobium album (ex Hu et al. 2023)]MCJ2180848.1 SDR family oxidoreductase [Novosphingobium album (ex Hu et al. 2023)]
MKTALVTGGGAGIGRAACMRLARDGMAVAVLGRRIGNAREVADAIAAQGGRAIAVAADVADEVQVSAALARIRSALGPVAVLVNNAGIEEFTPFAGIDDAAWDRVMDVNLKAVYRLTQNVLPDMEKAGWGRIVNVTALGAQIGAANMVHYTASKGGITAMTRSLAVELGRKGITVNAISPGFILTPMAQRAIDGDLFPVPYQDIVATYPVPRVGRPEEAAAAIAYFASEDAGYVTGQVLGVNGGCCP